ncbi:ABC transporter permease subunit [Mycoplasma aquilae ATCC BAA-1896]|uniref:ABC transporter permease subunit n=1 Tax=Mycoplasma aquilae TaxID=1312741 RepID=UPI003A8AF4EE
MTNSLKQPNSFSKAIVSSLEKTRKYFMFEDKKSNRRKFYSSLWAVVIGLFLANILYYAVGSSTSNGSLNFFSFFIDVFNFATGPSTFRNTIIFFIVFSFSGLAVAIGFKSGLFNIGVPGQMLLPGVIFFAVLISSRLPKDDISASYLVGMFFLSIIVGGIAGGLSGVLKAFFNVHEVISTIFINWIITFISIWVFTSTNNVLFSADSPSSYIKQWLNPPFGTSVIFISNELVNKFIYFGIAFVVFLMLAIWFIYSKTTLGYKIKMVGLNKTNAKYVGINEKLMIILIMFVSGALSGIAGFYYIVIQQKKVSLAAAPLNIGFDCIAIALIALNNPIGTVFTSILYAFLNAAQPGFQAVRSISRDFSPIITGLIVFMAALSLMFYSFRPLEWIRKQAVLTFHKEYWENFKIYHRLVHKTHRQKALDKQVIFLTNQWMDENSKKTDSLINNETLAAYDTDSINVVKYLYKKLYKNARKENNEILVNKLKEEYANYKNFIKQMIVSFKKEYDKNVAQAKTQLKILNAKYAANMKELKTNNKELIIEIAKNKEVSPELSNRINAYYFEINKVTSEYETEYFELLGKIKNITYHKKVHIAAKSIKVRKSEYKYLLKQYENKVSKLLILLKNKSPEEKMNIYDEISKLKFELYKNKDNLGLNKLIELKNIQKAEKRNSKQIYKSLKNRIFNDFHEKYFKTPYHNFVMKYVPMLNEEGEAI